MAFKVLDDVFPATLSASFLSLLLLQIYVSPIILILFAAALMGHLPSHHHTFLHVVPLPDKPHNTPAHSCSLTRALPLKLTVPSLTNAELQPGFRVFSMSSLNTQGFPIMGPVPLYFNDLPALTDCELRKDWRSAFGL